MTNPSSGHPFWQRVLGRAPQDEPDAADMGTCFGLEMSLGGASAAPLSGAPEPLPTWLERLSGKRSRLGSL